MGIEPPAGSPSHVSACPVVLNSIPARRFAPDPPDNTHNLPNKTYRPNPRGQLRKTWKWVKVGAARLCRSPLRSDLFRPNMGALFSYRAFHEQHQERHHQRQDGRHPEDVEVGQRRRLLLAEFRESLYGHLLRPGRIPGLLVENGSGLLQKSSHVLVEGVEELAHARKVELFASFLDGLGHGRADAATL